MRRRGTLKEDEELKPIVRTRGQGETQARDIGERLTAVRREVVRQLDSLWHTCVVSLHHGVSRAAIGDPLDRARVVLAKLQARGGRVHDVAQQPVDLGYVGVARAKISVGERHPLPGIWNKLSIVYDNIHLGTVALRLDDGYVSRVQVGSGWPLCDRITDVDLLMDPGCVARKRDDFERHYGISSPANAFATMSLAAAVPFCPVNLMMIAAPSSKARAVRVTVWLIAPTIIRAITSWLSTLVR